MEQGSAHLCATEVQDASLSVGSFAFLKKNRRFWDKAMVMEAMETRLEVGHEEEMELDLD